MKKEGQKFDLLAELHRAASTGKTIVKEAISRANGDKAIVGKTIVSVQELKATERLLEMAEEAPTLPLVRKFLTEETIPVELVVMEPFWGGFQEIIYKLKERVGEER